MSPNRSPAGRLWPALAFLLVLAAIFGLYYWVHKPITPAQSVAVVSMLADAGVALLLTLVGGGLGRRLLRAWMVRAESFTVSPGERITLEIALGWGILGMAMLGLGLADLYHPALIWALALLTCLALGRDVRDWIVDVRRAASELRPIDRFSQFAAGFVALTLGLGLLRALAPPLMWDALVYHLALPKLYAQAHSLRIDDDLLFTGLPQVNEMLYTAAMLLRGEIAAQVLGWSFGVMLALGLAAHATHVLGARLAYLAPAILFSSITMALSLAWAYADLLLMLMSLAMLIALRCWRLTGRRQWLWVSGMFAGLAVGCKYTGALVPLGGIAVIVLTFSASRSPLPALRSTLHPPRLLSHVLRFTLPACLFGLPWLIKNWLLTGSPVYPLLIPAGYMDALRQWFYTRPDLADRNLLRAAAVFLRATFLGVQSGNDFDATLGPVFVLLLMGLLIVWRKLDLRVRDDLASLVVFSTVGYLAWVVLTLTSPLALQTRLFFPIFPALSVLCAAGAGGFMRFDTPRLRASTVLNAALALAFGLAGLENLLNFAAHSPLGYLTGAQSAADYRASNLGWFAIAMDRLNSLPAGSRALFLWEARSLPCAAHVQCDPDVVIDRWWHLRRTLRSADAVLSQWRSEGVTHVLMFETGLNFARAEAASPFDPSDWAELDILRSHLWSVESLGGAYSLYALGP